MPDDDHPMDTQAQQDVWDHSEIEKIAAFLVKRGWHRRGNTFQRANAPHHYTISEAVLAEFGRRM